MLWDFKNRTGLKRSTLCNLDAITTLATLENGRRQCPAATFPPKGQSNEAVYHCLDRCHIQSNNAVIALFGFISQTMYLLFEGDIEKRNREGWWEKTWLSN